MKISVIIPAKNEQRHIKGTVESVVRYFQKQGGDYEIFVVTNRSTDHTGQMVREMAAEVPALQLLDYPTQGGKGFAVRTGMLKATGDYRLFMDADNSTTIDHLDRMLPYFQQGYDVVIGSIRADGHEVAEGSEPWYRVFLGRLSNIYTQIVLLPGIKDTQRGFKVFSARAAEDVFSCSRITQFGFDMEVLALARKFDYRIKEVPIRWKNDPDTASHPRLSAYVQVFLDTLRIKWWLMTGKYSRATIH